MRSVVLLTNQRPSATDLRSVVEELGGLWDAAAETARFDVRGGHAWLDLYGRQLDDWTKGEIAAFEATLGDSIRSVLAIHFGVGPQSEDLAERVLQLMQNRFGGVVDRDT